MLIGLTGRSGAGKSTVSRFFQKEGFRVIDCDAIVHRLYSDAAYSAKIAETFGNDCVSNGCVDRKKLAAIVFADEKKLQLLNRVASVFIKDAILKEIQCVRESGEDAVLDAPLLFEYELEKECDEVWGVVCDMETAVKRLLLRDGKSEAEIRARLSAQHDNDYFRRHCDFLVENNGDDEAFLQLYLDLQMELLRIRKRENK